MSHNPFKVQWLLCAPLGLTFRNSAFYQQSTVLMSKIDLVVLFVAVWITCKAEKLAVFTDVSLNVL